MLVKKDRVIYIPYPKENSNVNEYTLNMVEVLQEKYLVTGKLEDTLDLFQILRTKAIFLNWVEDKLDLKMCMQLKLYKLLGAKIVWVFHNKYPHDVGQSNEIVHNMRWLADNSSIIVLHSKSSIRFIPNVRHNRDKAVFIPHITYRNRDVADLEYTRKQYGISEKDFLFTIFGGIKPYKNIEKGIEIFQKLGLKNAKLLIAGPSYNVGYAKKIRMLCKGNPNIILDLRFVPDNILDSIVYMSDVILLPYKEGSSMNSGVMIKAFSQGKTVIAPDICMARDMAKNKFFYIYKGSFGKAMMEAYQNGRDVNIRMGKMARDYVYKHNNRKIVGEKIDKILS